MPPLRPESEIRPESASQGLPLRRWHAEDEQATEWEVSQLIGYLIVGLQPDVCIELGCYHGQTTEQIGRAIHENRHGHLHAIDSDAAALAVARDRCAGLAVSLQLADADTWLLPQCVDFAFVDHGEPADRIGVLPRLLEVMSSRGVIVWHDTGDQFPLRRQLETFLPGTGWNIVYLPTSRGLGIMSSWPFTARPLIV